MNLELMKKLKEQLNEKNSKAPSVLFKPTEGETVIRIVPLAGSPENPFQVLEFHYGFLGKNILSPRSYGEKDPISDFCDACRREGNMTKDEFKALMKRYAPTQRTYVPVVERGKEEEGVKFWAFGQKIFDQLLAIIADEDYGDISDPENGNDIKITFTPPKEGSNDFAKTELMVRPKKTPLAKDVALREKLLNQQPVLVDTFKKYSLQELNDLLDTSVSGASEAAAEATQEKQEDWGSTPKPEVEAKPQLSEETKNDFSALFD